MSTTVFWQSSCAVSVSALLTLVAGCLGGPDSRPAPHLWPSGRFEGVARAALRGDVGPVGIEDDHALHRFRHDEVTQVDVEGRDEATGSRAWLMFTSGHGQISPMILAADQEYSFPEDPRHPNPFPVRVEVRACSGPEDGAETFDAGVEAMTWRVEAAAAGELRVLFEAALADYSEEGPQRVFGFFDLTGAVYDDAVTSAASQ